MALEQQGQTSETEVNGGMTLIMGEEFLRAKVDTVLFRSNLMGFYPYLNFITQVEITQK